MVKKKKRTTSTLRQISGLSGARRFLNKEKEKSGTTREEKSRTSAREKRGGPEKGIKKKDGDNASPRGD